MDARYLELLKDENELKSKGKSLLVENEEDYLKLLKYEDSIWSHFQWEQKDRYFLVISNFLDKKIDIDQYRSQLYELRVDIQDLVEELKLDFEKLKEFQPNPVSKGFSGRLEELYSDCRVVEADPGDGDISETELIDYLRETFLQLQEYESKFIPENWEPY